MCPVSTIEIIHKYSVFVARSISNIPSMEANHHYHFGELSAAPHSLCSKNRTEQNLHSVARYVTLLEENRVSLNLLMNNVNVVYLGHRGICDGDSGGPLFNPATRDLVGIVSWSVDPCGSRYPDVFTRAFVHLQWIRHVTGVTPPRQ